MNSDLKPTPLKRLRHAKAWRLRQVYQELIKRNTPVSWPTLLKIEHGYKTKIIRDGSGKILKEKKVPYKPYQRTLEDLAKLFHTTADQIYEDRSKKIKNEKKN